MPPKPGSTRAPDHAGTWRKLDSGRWNVSGRFQGVPYSATAPTKTEARALQRQKIDAIRSGAASEKKKRETVAGFLAQFLTRKKGRVAPKTYASYRLAVAQLNENLGERRVSDLFSAQVVQDAYDALAARGLSGSSLAWAHTTLKQALRYAAEEGRHVPLIPKHIRPPRSRSEPARAIPLADLSRFLEAARQDEPLWYAMWELARYSGLRLGELLALRWEDVRPTSVAVRQSLSEDEHGDPWIKPYPKSAAGVRTVPIPREAVAPLEGLPHTTPGELVFANREGGPLLKSSASHAFQRAWAAAKLPEQAHIHLLRHTYAKSLFDLAVPLPLIASRMGHANPAITLSLYAHFRRDEPDEEPRALVEYYYAGNALQPHETGGNGALSGETTKTTTNARKWRGPNRASHR